MATGRQSDKQATADESFDVAVVGFGPVGAVLAGLLGKRGISVVVFDREAGLYRLPRAAHVDHTGLRTLQELGCLEELLPQMLVNPGTACVTADRRLLFEIPGDVPTPSGLPASMYFHQPTFDGTLRQVVGALPTVDVRLETEVVGLAETADGVKIETRGKDGESTFDAAWVIGCDGASSRIRQLAGIERTNFGFEEQWLIFDLKLGDIRPPLPLCAVQVCDPARPHTELPMPSGRFRFEFMLLPGEEPAELLHPEVAFDRLLAGLVPRESVQIERSATYTFSGLVADRWRRGRTFVAGDAAHLMPPFLGQGMCSGIRDAANLAWKLDLVHSHGAPESLLDTYEIERRPHVSEVIRSAIELGRIVCTTDWNTAIGRDRQMTVSSDNGARYRFSLPALTQGPLVLEGGGELSIQTGPDAAGRRLDDLVGHRFLVITSEEEHASWASRWWRESMGALVTTPSELPDPNRVEDWLKRRQARNMIVRPDRYILWRGDDFESTTEKVRPWLSEAGMTQPQRI